MDEREKNVLARYAQWKAIIEGHGLNFDKTVDEFVEMNSCNGTGGCVGDSCSGGNGSGCMAGTCSGSAGEGEKAHEYIELLVKERHEKLAQKPA